MTNQERLTPRTPQGTAISRITTTIADLDLPAFIELLGSPAARADLSAMAGTPVVVVDLSRSGPPLLDPWLPLVRGLPVVVVGQGSADSAAGGLCDLVVEDPGPVLETVGRNPLAAVTAALALRASLELDVAAALASESAAYSTLQAGPEFAGWRATRDPGVAGEPEATPVVLDRGDGTLCITLNRPHRHNAFGTAMRDALSDALLVALSDPGLGRVVLRGAGPSFCSGGDLDEFGTLPDPATAHLTRLTRNAGWLMSCLAERLEVRLHGAAFGAGIELAAFAGRVVADPDTTIALPEIDLGLIPGAGGTVSLPRRIGRHRTAELLLTRRRLDATTAHAWGLVDEIRQREPEGAR